MSRIKAPSPSMAISLLALPAQTLATVGLDDPYALGIGVFSATAPRPGQAGSAASSSS